MSDPVRILEIERQLAADQDGRVRDDICDAFDAERQQLKREMDRGLSTDQFQQCSRYLAALETASKVVKRVWESENRLRIAR